MSSLFSVPMQFVGVACEMVFVFENKLRGHTIERAKTPLMRKTDMILEEIVKVVLGNAILDDMSTARKPLSLEDLRALMLEAAGHPALKIGPESMGQVCRHSSIHFVDPRSEIKLLSLS